MFTTRNYRKGTQLWYLFVAMVVRMHYRRDPPSEIHCAPPITHSALWLSPFYSAPDNVQLFFFFNLCFSSAAWCSNTCVDDLISCLGLTFYPELWALYQKPLAS